MTITTGQTIHNRYRVVKLLGKGGFGAVYRVWDISLSRPCALKENLDTSPEAQRQFLREATVLANLSHPNLPRVTDHFIVPGQGQYLVMDFIDGEDLDSLVQRQGAVGTEQAIAWISQVADALTYLHHRNPPVLHRDIKPTNIRITPEGQAILVDFGLVKVYDPHLRTTQGARAITPGYSPPEQYGQGNTDARSDIYALGATLYHLLTAQHPQESLQRLGTDRLPPAHQVNARIPPVIGQVIQRSLELNPAQRFPSAAEFKAALTTAPLAATVMVSEPPPARYTPQPAIAAPRFEPQSLQQAFPHAAHQPVQPAGKGQKRPVLLYAGVGLGAALVFCAVIAFLLVAYNNQQSLQKIRVEQTDVARTATRMIAVQKTELAGAARTAQAGQTAQAEAQATAAAQAVLDATASAYAEQTAIAQKLSTATAEARAAYLAQLEAQRVVVFGPQNGSLAHDDDNFIEESLISSSITNFIAEARFVNPYPLSTGAWSSGFLLRDDGSQMLLISINSDSSWYLYHKLDEDWISLAYGYSAGLDTSENGSNFMRLICENGTGWLFLNGEFVAELDLSPQMNSGSLSIGTGLASGSEASGYATTYQDLLVWLLP